MIDRRVNVITGKVSAQRETSQGGSASDGMSLREMNGHHTARVWETA